MTGIAEIAPISIKTAPGRPFPKGKSGNPSGRPKVAISFRLSCREAVDKDCFPLWVKEVQTNGKNAMKASELLAAYGYGKPTEYVVVDATVAAVDPKEVEIAKQIIREQIANGRTNPATSN